MENYMYYSMMGGPIKLKAGVLPHIFECQGRVTPYNEDRDQFQRKRKIMDILSSKENLMESDLSMSGMVLYLMLLYYLNVFFM